MREFQIQIRVHTLNPILPEVLMEELSRLIESMQIVELQEICIIKEEKPDVRN